jgi:hypothetical protein
MNQFPQAPEFTIRAVSIFFENLRRYSQIKGKGKKSSIRKVLIILFGYLWEVGLTYRYIFAIKSTLFAAGVIDTGGKFAASVVDTVTNCHWCRCETGGKI